MSVVDTNVISEMMRDNPDQAVLAWTAAVGGLHTTTITPTVNRADSGERHELSVPHRKVQP